MFELDPHCDYASLTGEFNSKLGSFNFDLNRAQDYNHS